MAKRVTPKDKALKRADQRTRQFRKIVNYRVDGDSKTDVLRKFAKRWGMRVDSVQRYTSSPTATRYRRIRDKKRQQSVARIFNRMKREQEGFYYDMIIGKGESIKVTKYAIEGIPNPLSDYPEVLGDFAYFLNILKGNVWKKDVQIPRILFRTPGRGKRRMGMIKATIMVTADDKKGDRLTEVISISSPVKILGSTFGDFGDSELGVNKPARDLYNVFNITIKNLYEKAIGRKYEFIRIIFDPKVAKRIFPEDERAGELNITLFNALAETEIVRNVAGDPLFRPSDPRNPRTQLKKSGGYVAGWKDVSKRFKKRD